MDLFDPADQRPVHFMGVGGAGMSALALLALRRGVRVTGCDLDCSGADDLRSLGAALVEGHDAAHVAGSRALVVTAAVQAAHPELAAAHAQGVPVVPRKVALAGLVNGRTVVAIAGTHGKTTTTVMTTEALAAAGVAPTGLAGGRVAAWGGNALIGGDATFVVEADEYDRAFLELRPTVAVVNNVEADHLEIYGTVAAMEAAFADFAGRAPTVLCGADDDGARRLAAALGARARLVGLADDAHVPVRDVRTDADGTTATVMLPRAGAVTLRLGVPGLHNVRNAAMALAVTDALGAPVSRALDALAAFRGVGRRFERVGEARGVQVVDDYAHHPTELEVTLAAARQAFPGRRLVAVFQPHLFSRTQVHGEAMGRALAAADVVVVTEIYGAREQPVPGVSGRAVAEASGRAGRTAHFEPDRAAVTGTVAGLVRAGDVVLTLGAGDITRVGPELVRALA
ncbi:MAG: UDP-N-acetylmuramate--L-alanine ligase [Gemmatimonadales bacterium]|nr:UDP-N-acetylmuramate--L-alanine ligase [Gemmatimonadales bacterium]